MDIVTHGLVGALVARAVAARAPWPVIHSTGELADVATAVRLVMTDNPNLKTLIPHHHRVTPQPGQTTVAEVRAALDAAGIRIPITTPARAQVYEFRK